MADQKSRRTLLPQGFDIESVAKLTPVGSVTDAVVALINYPHSPGIILLGPTNVTHMKQAHPSEYAAYKDKLVGILNDPEYVGINPTDGSIQYVQIFDKKVAVAVRVSKSGQYFARSMYALSEYQFTSYLASGRLHKVK